MNKFLRQPDRRQFGRRWSEVHGWIQIVGRPRIPAAVCNFSEAGALLRVANALSLPYTFRLAIDAIEFEIGCEVRHRRGDAIGVRFIAADLVSEIGPIWSIDELMSRASAPQRKLAS